MTTLTMRDEKRLDVIQRVYRSELTVGQVALVLGVSERQCYRIKARVGKAGAKGVVHGNRGRPCKRKIKEKVVNRVVELGVCLRNGRRQNQFPFPNTDSMFSTAENVI